MCGYIFLICVEIVAELSYSNVCTFAGIGIGIGIGIGWGQ
jgi:hypothetical protein